MEIMYSIDIRMARKKIFQKEYELVCIVRSVLCKAFFSFFGKDNIYTFIIRQITLFCSVHKAATNYKKRQMLSSLKAFPATTVSLCTSQQAGSE